MRKIMCIFGDSIVFGEGDKEKGGWVSRLRHYVDNKGIDLRIYNLGIGGDTTEGLLERIEIESKLRKPDYIILSIGVNDSKYIKSRNTILVPIDKFHTNFQKIIDTAKKFGKIVLVVGLLNIDEPKNTPRLSNHDVYIYQKDVVQYDKEIRQLCKRNKLDYLKMQETVGINELTDGLHPSSEGYEKIFTKIKKELIKLNIL